MTSTRPYLIRAFYQWIIDNSFTPYIVVNTGVPNVFVPTQYIEEDRIILNISPFATDKLEITNQFIDFDASFSGYMEHISAPIHSVLAIYAKENGKGMVFNDEEHGGDDGGGDGGGLTPTEPAKPGNDKEQNAKRAKLRIVK